MSTDRQLEECVARWREAAPLLESMHGHQLMETPLPIAMDQSSSMVQSAIFLKPLTHTSGLVEMQRILARLRE